MDINASKQIGQRSNWRCGDEKGRYNKFRNSLFLGPGFSYLDYWFLAELMKKKVPDGVDNTFLYNEKYSGAKRLRRCVPTKKIHIFETVGSHVG